VKSTSSHRGRRGIYYRCNVDHAVGQYGGQGGTGLRYADKILAYRLAQSWQQHRRKNAHYQHWNWIN